MFKRIRIRLKCWWIRNHETLLFWGWIPRNMWQVGMADDDTNTVEWGYITPVLSAEDLNAEIDACVGGGSHPQFRRVRMSYRKLRSMPEFQGW